MKGKEYTWFIAPKNGKANEIISRICQAEDYLDDILCTDGMRRNMWRCSKLIRDAVIKSELIIGIDIEILCDDSRIPSIRRIRNVSFLFKNKKPVKKVFTASQLAS